MQLVLSLFPGIDLLGLAFKRAGFCVVQGGDVIFGGDIRDEHYPAGRFDGVIGGPPCQMFSRLAHMVRHNGLQPRFGNLIPEFERVVSEAQPQWFVMEQVPDAPLPAVDGYGVHSFLLNNRQLGEPQNRVRRLSFGWRGERRVLMVETVALEAMEFEYAATGGSARPVALGGSSKPKKYRDGKGAMPWNAKSSAAVTELCRKQGIAEAEAWLRHMPWRQDGLCKALGNAVPLPMGSAIARAVKEATEC